MALSVTIIPSLKDSREACQEVNCAEWVWRADDGRTTLLCGAGHAGPRPFMTIRSPALHPIKRCVIKAFGLATNQHYFGAAGESLLRGKLDGSLSGFCTSLAKPPVQAIRSAGWLRRYCVWNKARVSPALRQELPGDSSHQTRRGQDTVERTSRTAKPRRLASPRRCLITDSSCSLNV